MRRGTEPEDALRPRSQNEERSRQHEAGQRSRGRDPASVRAPALLARPVAAALTAAVLLAQGALAAPDEGDCPSLQATHDDGAVIEDAAPIVVKTGMVVDKDSLLALRSLLPPELWKHREIFFYEGMQMEIGPCHRRYIVPKAYRAATERFRGEPKIDKHGNLKDYTAGQPFSPDDFDDDDRDAALRWAWNFEKRYRGAGHRGLMRIRSHPSGMGRTQTYRGDFSLLKTRERADLWEQDYQVPDAKDRVWVGGGAFTHPFAARGLAWRQFRVEKSTRRWEEPDDVFVYVPEMRKVRRSATNWIDGFFVPKFTWAGQTGGGGVSVQGGGINPSAGINIGTSEDARIGFTGLTIRPNAYGWRMRGRTVVIAPLNGTATGYPLNEERNFGYSGLSLADDRWDVRAAVVIEGALKRKDETIRTVTIYLDEMTLQPLYWISRTDRRRVVEIGVLAHRYTADVQGYPEWPGGSQAHVFEPVAAAFFNALAGRGGWIRESFDLNSLPFSDDERREMMTADTLLRGH